MNAESNTAILYITDNGFALAKKLNSLDPNAKVFKFKPDKVSKFWVKHKNFIFIMASGIVVRTIAPLIKNKKTDPAVVVLDEKGEYAISLLSGHLGGANKIVREIAGFLGSQAVVTTASDVNNLPAIDLWAIENHLVIEDWNLLPQVTTKFLNKGNLKVYSDIVISMPTGFQAIDNPESADIIITNKNGLFTRSPASEGKPIHPFIQLYLRPKNLVIGIGCNSGTSADEIESSVRNTLTKNNLSFLSIHSIATIDRKGKEPGIVEFAKKYNFKIITFRPDELNSVKGIQKSESAFKATGAKAVAEPAALLASGSNNVLVPKQKVGNVTVAVAELRSEHRAKNTEQRQKGKLYIVGTGPGGIAHITPYAQNAIRKSDVIVGYSTYLDLIQGLIKDKEIRKR
ncbi:MAG: cobalamin biosynthesis protein [Nitrospirae bacterium]|nr:cobalamin biosynthesis protein [Nitrospirota bacterium]